MTSLRFSFVKMSAIGILSNLVAAWGEMMSRYLRSLIRRAGAAGAVVGAWVCAREYSGLRRRRGCRGGR